MAYDEKTGTIKIGANDTEDDLLRDTFAHFANVERQIAKDYPEKFKSAKPSLIDRLHGLSKPVKGGIVAMAAWTIFVIYRTAGYHEFLGMDLSRWDEDDFLMNWLGLPVIVLGLVYAVSWVMRERKPVKKAVIPASSPLNDFQKELDTWEPCDAQLALLLIKATMIGDQKSIKRISGELTVEQFRKTVHVVKQMRGDA